MIVKNLIDHPELLETLAQWHYTEWGALYPEEELQDFIEDLRGSQPGELLPATWVLMEEDQVWGSASVIEQDMNTNTELRPWLANVYIHPDKRALGLGRALVKEVLAQCRARGIKQLFLFTPDHQAFYQSLGWETLKQERYEGKRVFVMTIRFKR